MKKITANNNGSRTDQDCDEQDSETAIFSSPSPTTPKLPSLPTVVTFRSQLHLVRLRQCEGRGHNRKTGERVLRWRGKGGEEEEGVKNGEEKDGGRRG